MFVLTFHCGDNVYRVQGEKQHRLKKWFDTCRRLTIALTNAEFQKMVSSLLFWRENHIQLHVVIESESRMFLKRLSKILVQILFFFTSWNKFAFIDNVREINTHQYNNPDKSSRIFLQNSLKYQVFDFWLSGRFLSEEIW